MTSSTELLGVYAVNDDYSIIGGASTTAVDVRGTFIPAGIQYKDVPIVIEYNPEHKSVGVGRSVSSSKKTKKIAQNGCFLYVFSSVCCPSHSKGST